MTKSVSGFSLVELSIVLVILGLLTGGILTGQNLIRAAELRSVATQLTAYQTAVHSFRDKYFALPGDITNAADFWGSAGGFGTIGDGCESTTGSGTETCNGDGNGYIGIAPAASQYGEIFTFWQHLANAGMIEGSYTGIAGTVGTTDHNFGENAPVAKISSLGWGANYTNNSTGTQNTIWLRDYRKAMTLGGDDGTWADNPNNALVPEEAWNIDKKLDDGRPGTGKIHTYPVTGCSDQTDNSLYDSAEYNLTNTSKICALLVNYLN